MSVRENPPLAAGSIPVQRLGDQLRLLAETSHDVIGLFDRDGRRLYMNPRGLELLGVSDEAGHHHGPFDHIHRADRDRITEEWSQIARTGQPRRLEARITQPDGTERFMQCEANPVRDASGRVIAILGIGRDVTDERRGDVMRRVTLETIFEQAPIGISIKDREGRFLAANRRLQQMLGYDEDELLKMTVFDITLEEELPRLRKLREELFSGRRDQTQQEKRVRRKSGEAVWINHITAVVRTPSGEPAFTIELAVDISERKQAEEQALAAARKIQSLSEQREAHLRLVIDTIPAMAWSLLPDGTVDFVNKRWLEYSGESLERTLEDATRQIHPEDVARAMEKWGRDMARGQASEDEIRLRRADGEYRWFLVRTLPLRDEQGNIVKWYGTSTDIEDRKTAADTLRESERKARRLAEKSRALARRLVELQEKERRDIARELHDRVGQTLTAMRINMDLIGKRLDEHDDPLIRHRNEDSRGLIEAAFKAVENVMYDLRPPMLEEHGLMAPLQWYARNFTERTGIRVDIRGDEDWRCRPEVELALFRIAQEALNNVARHAQARRVEIQFHSADEGAVFTVEDDGKGFDRDGERGAKAGYGLITMRERAESVSGTFEARSESGRGTRITVKVPLRP